MLKVPHSWGLQWGSSWRPSAFGALLRGHAAAPGNASTRRSGTQRGDGPEASKAGRAVSGESAQVLSEVAEEGDGPSLLVMGSRGLGTCERIVIGSVSSKVLRAARRPVLVCPRRAPNGA